MRIILAQTNYAQIIGSRILRLTPFHIAINTWARVYYKTAIQGNFDPQADHGALSNTTNPARKAGFCAATISYMIF